MSRNLAFKRHLHGSLDISAGANIRTVVFIIVFRMCWRFSYIYLAINELGVGKTPEVRVSLEAAFMTKAS